MKKKIIAILLAIFVMATMMPINTFAASKYVKSLKLSTANFSTSKGKTVTTTATVSVKGKASRKIKFSISNKKIVKVTKGSVSSSGKTKIKIKALKSGKAKIKINTVGKNKKGKSLTKTINISVGKNKDKDSSLLAPTGLTKVSCTENTITISWNSVSGAEKYNIYMGSSKTTAQKNKSLIGTTTSTSYTVSRNAAGYNLNKNTGYYISVTAVKGSTESASSDVRYYKTSIDKYVEVKENIKLAYSANNSATKTTIYLGEDWSNSVKNALSNGSSATYEFNRPDVYFEFDPNTTLSQKSYVFDAGDYDNYLVVNVIAGQISSWYTNAKVQAIANNVTVYRGDNTTFSEQRILVRYDNVVAPLLVPFNISDYEMNGMVISGAQTDPNELCYKYSTQNPYEPTNFNRWHEKQIGLHLINAYRVLSNRRGHKLNPLEYNKYLDGTEQNGSYITYTGDVKVRLTDESLSTYHVTNQAFGAQGFVDTLTATKPVNTTTSMHSMDSRSGGPCGGADKDLSGILTDWSNILYKCGDEKSKGTLLQCVCTNGNAASGGLGESALTSYTKSTGHLTWYTADNDNLHYIGIGIKDGYNQVFGGVGSN